MDAGLAESCPQCGEDAIAFDPSGLCYVCQSCGFVPQEQGFVSYEETGARGELPENHYASGPPGVASAYAIAASNRHYDGGRAGTGSLAAGPYDPRLAAAIRSAADPAGQSRERRQRQQLDELQGLAAKLRLPGTVLQLAAGFLSRIHDAEATAAATRAGPRAVPRADPGDLAGPQAGSSAASATAVLATDGVAATSPVSSAYKGPDADPNPDPGADPTPDPDADPDPNPDPGGRPHSVSAANPGHRKRPAPDLGCDPHSLRAAGGTDEDDTGGSGKRHRCGGAEDDGGVEGDGGDSGGGGSGTVVPPGDEPLEHPGCGRGRDRYRDRDRERVPSLGGHQTAARVGALLYLASRSERGSLTLAEVAAAACANMFWVGELARQQAAFLQLWLPAVDLERFVLRIALQLISLPGPLQQQNQQQQHQQQHQRPPLAASGTQVAAGADRDPGDAGPGQGGSGCTTPVSESDLRSHPLVRSAVQLTGLVVRRGWHEGKTPRAVAGALLSICLDSLYPAYAAVRRSAAGPQGSGSGQGAAGGTSGGTGGGGSGGGAPLTSEQLARIAMCGPSTLVTVKQEMLGHLTRLASALPFGPLVSPANVAAYLDVLLLAADAVAVLQLSGSSG